MENRLKWCRGKADWGYDKWKYVVWSDESKFNIVGNDGGARVLRKEGERYDSNHVIKTTKFGSGSLMLWGCFWSGGFGPLVVLDAKDFDLGPLDENQGNGAEVSGDTVSGPTVVGPPSSVPTIGVSTTSGCATNAGPTSNVGPGRDAITDDNPMIMSFEEADSVMSWSNEQDLVCCALPVVVSEEEAVEGAVNTLLSENAGYLKKIASGVLSEAERSKAFSKVIKNRHDISALMQQYKCDMLNPSDAVITKGAKKGECLVLGQAM
ncbi:hypothetical protein [Parasitella parasitica]|uniref:Uncharacterized protein n=1 Tax=Parasitella parasitica TaxID=35722 RepID=A0A0B7N0Z2_9FUNG|nr:hypothetical protein [Parasitella parasitica]